VLSGLASGPAFWRALRAAGGTQGTTAHAH
jgi:hypothetical protein